MRMCAQHFSKTTVTNGLVTSPEKTMRTSAVFGGVAIMALLTIASVHAHKQTLLETQLVDEDVVTKTGKKIPVSQVCGTGRILAPRSGSPVAARAAC